MGSNYTVVRVVVTEVIFKTLLFQFVVLHKLIGTYVVDAAFLTRDVFTHFFHILCYALVNL